MTTATVNPDGTDVYVLVKCYTGDRAFMYAAYFPVDANKTGQIGPLSSSLWTILGGNLLGRGVTTRGTASASGS